MTATNSLVLRPHPFTLDAGVLPVRSGQTLQAMLDEAAGGGEITATLRVEIGGYEVPRELWARVRPKAGTPIHATVMPAGGDGNKILRTVLLIVVAIFAWYAAPYLTGTWGVLAGASTTLVASGLYMVGALLVNALVPPPKPPGLGGGGSAEIGRWNALTGSSNQANPYGPIPFVIGESRIYPPHAAMPYSETIGTVSYQRLMFDLGHGDLDVSDLRIGNTPIAEFDDVEWEITKTPTLYTDDVNEQNVSAAMNDGADVIRTTAPDVDEISLDVVFPQGLFGVNDKGRDVAATVDLDIQYRLVGDTTWMTIPAPGILTGGKMPRRSGVGWTGTASAPVQARTGDRKPFAASYAWGVVKGQYEVRVRRVATNWGTASENSRIGDAVWSVLRSIKNTNPSTTGTTKLCMRIKASEQLNGTLSTFSCLVRQKIRAWDRTSGTWLAPAVTLNPAWIYAWLLTQCEAISIHVPESRVDLENLADFADFCTAHDFEVRGTVDYRTTARALLDDVLACSLGAVSLRDGKYGVIFDPGDQSVPNMVFTPLDTKGFSVSRVFTRLPHALKVQFRNPNADWEVDEIVVVDDGYSHRGKGPRGGASTDPEATEFETLEVRFAADAHQAWRIARHHLAQAKFRPSTYSWETDVANLACTRGDLVHVAHDVPDWGLGWGRIKAIDSNVITLDESIALASASYSARLQLSDGSSITRAITGAVAGETNAFTLDTAPAGAQVGDVVVVGETSQETAPLLITGIRPSADLGAGMSAVAFDSRVLPYWTNPPAAIVSEITGTVYRDPPPAPDITVIISNQSNSQPDDAGTTKPVVIIGTKPPSGYIPPDDNGPPWTVRK